MSIVSSLLKDALQMAVDSSSTAGGGGGGSNRGALDFGNPLDNLYAFGKIWGSYGDMPQVSCFHGTMFGRVANERLKPLFGYAGTGLIQSKVMPNGHIRMRGKETGYFTDLATGEVMETWKNPYTGETVEVYNFTNDRIRGELTAEMPRYDFGEEGDQATLMNEGSVVQSEDGTVPFVLPWEIYGDQVLLPWDYAHAYTNPVTPEGWPRASTGETVSQSEHFNIYTSLAELEDRDNPSAAYRAGFSRMSNWWPWMMMGKSELSAGVLFGRMFSRTCLRGLDDIPAPIRRYTEEHYPDHLEPADDWDDGGPITTWEAYARDVPPEVV